MEYSVLSGCYMVRVRVGRRLPASSLDLLGAPIRKFHASTLFTNSPGDVISVRRDLKGRYPIQRCRETKKFHFPNLSSGWLLSAMGGQE